jgi:hypothetical protein
VDVSVEVAPVDYVAAALVSLSRQHDSAGMVFHLVNPKPVNLSECVDALRSLGHPLRQVPYEQWRTELIDAAMCSGEHPLSGVLPLLVERAGKSPPIFEGLQFGCENTLSALARSPITCPPIDGKLLGTYLSYAAQKGLLNVAPAPGAEGLRKAPVDDTRPEPSRVRSGKPAEWIRTSHVCPAESFGQPSPPSVKLEPRPLLPLFAAGEIASVDAASLLYLPISLLEYTRLSRDQVIHDWFGNLPVFAGVMETFLGRIAYLILPRFASELYSDEEDLVRVVVEALEVAGRLGARTVSLPGLLPSATDYGRAVAAAVADRDDLPAVSTGHATTAAAVVLAINGILQKGGRDLDREQVGFLGLGSIGMTSLRLMLRCLPHPAAIVLCDVYSKLDCLEEIQREVIDELGFRGSVRVLESQGAVPPEFYDATLIIGATNVPDVLDVARIRPGTMIVDDSSPHCFAPAASIRRFREQEDILFTEGGRLRLPHPTSELRHLPRPLEDVIKATQMEEAYLRPDPYETGGCILSSVLSSRFDDLEPTVGLADVDSCFQHYERLVELEVRAADLVCEGYVLAEESIASFRRRFGSDVSSREAVSLASPMSRF